MIEEIDLKGYEIMRLNIAKRISLYLMMFGTLIITPATLMFVEVTPTPFNVMFIVMISVMFNVMISLMVYVMILVICVR